MNKNDPKLTAFVLGELSEDEALEVQAALDADEELRKEVDAIRQTVAEIEEVMKNEPLLRDSVSEKTVTPGDLDRAESPKKRRRFWIPAGIAALLLAVGAGVYVAQNDTTNSISKINETEHALKAPASGMDSRLADSDDTLAFSTEREFLKESGPLETHENSIQERQSDAWSAERAIPMDAPDFASNIGQPRVSKERSKLEDSTFDANQSGGAAGGASASRNARPGTFRMMQSVAESNEQESSDESGSVQKKQLAKTGNGILDLSSSDLSDSNQYSGGTEISRGDLRRRDSELSPDPAKPSRESGSIAGTIVGPTEIALPDTQFLKSEPISGDTSYGSPLSQEKKESDRMNWALEEKAPGSTPQKTIENGDNLTAGLTEPAGSFSVDLSVPSNPKSEMPVVVGGATSQPVPPPATAPKQLNQSVIIAKRAPETKNAEGQLGRPSPTPTPPQGFASGSGEAEGMGKALYVGGKEKSGGEKSDKSEGKLSSGTVSNLFGMHDQRKPERLQESEKTPEMLAMRGTKEYDAAVDELRRRVEDSKKPAFHDPYNASNAEAYKNFVENEFKPVTVGEFSTFSADVDTAAYTTMRRFIKDMNQRPPADSVRLEEYVNYFKYDYPQPTDGKPFAVLTDVSPCPWEPTHLLARIGIKGKEYTVDERPPLNLVFLIDTSGSMSSENRLPLVKRGLTELVEMLQPKDRVAIVTYAGSSRLALPSISGQEKRAILDTVDALNASGSTAGAEGIKTAYETARKYYDAKAQNRVILCTDGDFNVGTTDNKTLEQMIGEQAKSGVFLTVLGFGMGNYKDDRLKTLSMRGNGNYGYIDSYDEARRMLVDDLTGTLFTIAKDVKIQVDFNPKRVAGYRLLGYENRKLKDEDFHNDKVDAGDIGAGHTVTALYEIVPAGIRLPQAVDKSRYDETDQAFGETEKSDSEKLADEKSAERARELMFVKLRYKLPDEDKSTLMEYPVVYSGVYEGEPTSSTEPATTLSADSQFAAGVALFGMLLRQSRYSGDGNWATVLELAEPNVKDDPYRKEFVELVKKEAEKESAFSRARASRSDASIRLESMQAAPDSEKSPPAAPTAPEAKPAD